MLIQSSSFLTLSLAILAICIALVIAGAWLYRKSRLDEKHNTIAMDIRDASIQERPVLERMDGKPLDTIEEAIANEDAIIVGVTKPVGAWTSKVFSERLGVILGQLNGVRTEGYWVKLIHSQQGTQQQQRGPRK